METTTVSNKKYTISANDKDKFVSLLLLDNIMNWDGELPILMSDDYKVLEDLVIKLYSKQYLIIVDGKYRPAPKGKDALKIFMQRYSEYLKIYDVFSFVDLTKGEFAFKKFFDFETDDDWNSYIKDDRWEDLRVAVAEFKKLNPVEIVFMSFIKEGRFDLKKTGWQFDIVADLIWDEILNVCNTNLSVERVNQGNDKVMPDIIEQGSKITVDLIKREEKIRADEIKFEEDKQKLENLTGNNNEVVKETTVTETITEDNYYNPSSYYTSYYDPFYVSPFWLIPLFLL